MISFYYLYTIINKYGCFLFTKNLKKMEGNVYRVRQNNTLDREDGTSLVFGTCPFSQKTYQVIVETSALRQFMNGAHAQNAFPDLNRDDREFLISGISPEGWRGAFGNK